MTDTEAYLSVAEFALEVSCEWIDPDAFDGLSAAMESIEFAAPFGIFQVLLKRGFSTKVSSNTGR